MKIKICKGCKRPVEIIEERDSNGSNIVIVHRCPKCGYAETITNSYIHYGEDGKRN